MKAKTLMLSSRAVFALVISATLITSCSKGDLDYKRKNTTTPTTPAPAPEPTPTPVPPTSGTAFLSLTKSSTGRVISGQSNVVIENLQFTNVTGNPLYIKGSNNITIRNCFFNKATAEAIVIENSATITVENCLFNGVTTGVYALSSQTIKVRNNQFVNVRQRSIGGRGQFVQFNGVTGAGNAIEGNKGENFAGESDPEDLISLFRSSGTASSPIYVRNNMFRGGGPSASGGGIMSGDYGGSYQIVENNTLLDPGQYGIAAAGGSNITLINNKIYAKQQPFTNNPLYVWAQQGAACSNINVKGNRVYWIDKTGTRNNGWNAGNCSSTSFEYPTTITLAEMGVPTHLITMITPTELLQIRQ
ncbi:MAG TPA: right-handed parallel beta-helix repeat-containing protein [Chitinophagaceae bacterium]|nr:right-handed parallel beta-helix repeat-containing protein [Chitinophagaceae bacterium]